MKKFKRVSVQGGSLRGARYSDVSEADIRKSAKSYRGDPRFSQFCKQWVAAETFASDPELEKRTSEGLDKTSQAKTWLGLGWLSVFGFTKDNWRGVQQRLKGRWMTSFWVLLFLMVVISRPAFGRLCARLFGLTLRFCFRRLVTLILSIIDTILEEAILQAESALVPDPAPNNPTPSDNQLARDTVPSYFVHLLCMVLGALVSRQFPGTLTGPIRPPVNWLWKFCNVARLEGVGRHINKSRFVCVCDAPIRYQPMLQQLISQLCYAKRRTIIQYRCAPDERKSDWAQLQLTAHFESQTWSDHVWSVGCRVSWLTSTFPTATWEDISTNLALCVCVCVMHPFAISRCFSNWFHSYATPKGVPSSNTGVPQMNEKVIGRSCSWQHTLNLKHIYIYIYIYLVHVKVANIVGQFKKQTTVPTRGIPCVEKTHPWWNTSAFSSRSHAWNEPGKSWSLDCEKNEAKRKKWASWKQLGVEPKIRGKHPKGMVKIMENPINPWMTWGKPTIFGNNNLKLATMKYSQVLIRRNNILKIVYMFHSLPCWRTSFFWLKLR